VARTASSTFLEGALPSDSESKRIVSPVEATTPASRTGQTPAGTSAIQRTMWSSCPAGLRFVAPARSLNPSGSPLDPIRAVVGEPEASPDHVVVRGVGIVGGVLGRLRERQPAPKVRRVPQPLCEQRRLAAAPAVGLPRRAEAEARPISIVGPQPRRLTDCPPVSLCG
jgi:hypothetical protein